MSELLSLNERTVLVTGGGQGVGRQVALYCAGHGAAVVVNDFDAGRAEAVAAEVEEARGRALAAQCDVTDFDAVMAMVERAAGELGPVDVLVNNAGNAGPRQDVLAASPPFWETDPSDWEPWMGTSYYGVLNCTRAALPAMVQREWGRVITVISDAGRVGEPNLVVYGGAKAGAAGFSRSLAKAVGRHNVTVNCVALSTMRTPATEAAMGDEARVKKMFSQYVIRRPGEPEDAAAMVLFLASDAAAWITGQTYPVNGGYAFAM